MKKTLACPLCNQKNLIPIFDSKNPLPKYNLERHYNRDKALKARREKITFYFCQDCLFAFNGAFNESKMDYLVDYESSRAYSKYFEHYLEKICQTLDKTFSLFNKTVVEVGCGDGQFLKKLRQKYKVKCYGYDPNVSKDLFSQSINSSRTSDLKFVQGHYRPDSLENPPDVIILRHILEHQKNPHLFLKGILPPSQADVITNIYIEVPAWEWIIDNNWIFAFSYEHCSYYSRLAIEKVMSSHNYLTKRVLFGFSAEYIQYYGTNSNSIGLVKEDKSPQEDILEKTIKFSQQAPQIFKKIKNYLNPFFGKSILWGAGGKGTMLLNILNIGYDKLGYVVDSNPGRQNTYIPITGQQVIAPEFLKKLRPKYILLTNSAYQAEINSQIKNLNLKTRLVPVDEIIRKM